ncbi:LRRN4 C-terminal-like protein [Cheilinus undulatus]|uniref:LRRN4 C-terminal-like protein n=1 Tax=Cheilinus undulatus TaxID=241271 RepID=UPI001BD6BC44|nr:LRRN4 C-terminal-like protein [Cheilinus undulatus]
MMSLCRILTTLLLFLIASPLPNSHFFSHAAITSPPTTRHRINYSSLDEDEEDIQIAKKTTPVQQGPLQPCKYDSCSENQEPCASLLEKYGCLCPGVSREDRPPQPPRIMALNPISTGADRGKIEVKWCAPSSVVSEYKVVIEGSEGEPEKFKDISRRGVISSVEVGTRVCVQAVNKAGSSGESEFSCMRFNHHESSDQKLFAGVIVGGVALLLILIIAAVIIWKYKMHKKAKGDSTDGLGNPSYSTQETL